jgi:hypothetical protein
MPLVDGFCSDCAPRHKYRRSSEGHNCLVCGESAYDDETPPYCTGKAVAVEIASAEQFVRAFPKIAEQFDKDYARAAKKPHEVDNDFPEPDSEYRPFPDRDVKLSKPRVFEVEL